MFLPNKAVPLNESSLLKATKLLSKLETDTEIIQLYKKNKKLFLDIPDFIDALDLLFVLGKVNFNENSGVIYIA